jgi:DNA-binding CsgD family transcriptional regulator
VTGAHLSARALDLLLPGDPDRALLTAETVTLLHRARRSDEAAMLAERALAGVLPPHEEAEVRLSLSSMMTRPTVARAEESRRALALPGLTPLIRGRHLAWMAYNLGTGGEVEHAEGAAESALSAAEVTGDVETRVIAGIALAAVEGGSGGHSRALTRIESLRRSSHPHGGALFAAVLAFHHAHSLAVLGRLDEARAVVVDGIVSARDERDWMVLTTWTQFGGLLSLAAGQLSDARAEVASPLPREDEPAADAFAGVVRMVALSCLGAHLGDAALLRAGRAAARRVRADSSPAIRRLAIRLLARTASGRGSADEAARLLAEDPLTPATPLVPNEIGYHPWAARVARAAGATDLGERAATAAETLARLNPHVPLLTGLACHTRGIVTNDAALLVDAARLLEPTQRPLLAAAAAEDAGRVLAEGRRRSEAVGHLDRALNTYAAHGATADAGRVGQLLRRNGVTRGPRADRPQNGLASLTGSELQVVRIIAAGATNRSAAEQLHLSPHTVSSHLRSAFAKLGINSRVQLARVLPEVEA